MKNLVLSLTLIFASFSVIAQQADIEGHARIRGNLDLGHMDDATSIQIGLSAGENTNHSDHRYNTFVGSLSGQSNITGSYNAYFGRNSGINNSGGSYNTFLGYTAGARISDGNNNVCIGSRAGPAASNSTVSSKLYIDIERSDTPLIYGEFDQDRVEINGSLEIENGLKVGPSSLIDQVAITSTVADDVLIKNESSNAFAIIQLEGGNGGKFWMFADGKIRANNLGNIGNKKNMTYDTNTGEIGYDNSSRRYKSNIETLEDDWAKIFSVRPVSYTRPASPGHKENGYIAEEMDSIGLSNLVGYDQEGLPDDVKYDRIVLYLTEIVKRQECRISALEVKLASSNTAKEAQKRPDRDTETKYSVRSPD